MKVQNESAPQYINQNPMPATLSAADDRAINHAIAICQSRLIKYGHSFTSPDATRNYCLLKMSKLEAEQFDVLFLNNQNQLISCETMFKGTIDGASVYPREVVKRALMLNAAAVIFAHNHPSGICTPSAADIAITRKLKDAMSLMDIRTLDHLIVGGTETYSFAESGLL